MSIRGNNKRPSQPKCKSPSNGRINSLTAAIRLDSAVTSGPEVIIGLGDTAEVDTVAEAEAKAAAVSSVLREMIAS